MENTWKYKIELLDELVFDKIEKERNITIPKEMREFIKERNGAAPEKYRFMLGTNEKVLGAVLSFNEDEKDTDTVYTALLAVQDKKLLPFAIDPFGNYICLDTEGNEVVYWEHETEKWISLGKGFGEFLKELY